jgi:hypothetical protein
VAIAIASSIGGFSNWLTGEPGTPAPPGAQQAFANGTRSWAGFPSGTQLRQLAQATVGGTTYTLYGFRGAGALCLRLEVTAPQAIQPIHDLVCPPLSQLRANAGPALVAVSDYGVGEGKRPKSTIPLPAFNVPPPAARVTFGIVADGVNRIELAHSDGKTTNAVVSGDSFLSVDNQPSTSERVTHVWALASGKKISIPFTSQSPLPFSPATSTAPKLTAQGPSKVQRVVHGGAIRWLARREPEGTPVPKDIHDIVGTSKTVIFAREITPDPSAPEHLVVSVLPAGNRFGAHLLNALQVCVDVVGGRYKDGGGCWPAGRLFSTAPFSWGVGDDGSQYVTISGLASDDVARLALYLGTGQEEAVPLHDNGYLIEAPVVDEPLRLVAYDRQGLVIGTKTLEGQAEMSSGVPAPARPVSNAHWRLVLKNAAGEVFVAPSTTGGVCYAVRTGQNGGGSLGCPAAEPATGIGIGTSWNAKNGTTLQLSTGTAIKSVIVRYRNGHTQRLEASDGIVLARVPGTARAKGAIAAADPTNIIFGGLVGVTGLNARGQVVAVQNIFDRTGGSGTISKLTPSSISIGKAACRITPSSPSLAGYETGTHVQYLCDHGVLSLIGRSKAGHAWPNRTVLSSGLITRVTSSSITINDTQQAVAGESALRTCVATSTSPSLGAYRRGQRVQMFCVNGKLTGINRL